MGKASIHIQKASGGAITHNSRENYSKSVVFKDEKNELWNDKKSAFQIYREELKNRVEAYTNRTNQKLQKTAVTHLSAVVNLEQKHTLKDLEKIKDELEKVFDTKVFQMAIHRDEGKIKHKETGEYLVSGIDFFYNEQDNKYYTKKDKNKYENELNIYEYDIEKNYHAHIEFMGLDSQGQAIRQKMNRFVLSNLQDFTAQTLNMERGNNYQIKKSAKRLDTHDFKAEKKRENEVIKTVKTEKNKVIKKANEIIKDERTQKQKLKEDLDILKEENNKARAELKELKGVREEYSKLENLNKKLQEDLKNKSIDLDEALKQIKDLKQEVFSPKYKDNNAPAKNIDVVKFLEKKNNQLETDLKATRNEKQILEEKVLTLEDKVVSSSIMNDYELLKKENESLKQENSFLKRVIDKVLTYANSKIKELVRFGKPQVKQSVEFEDFSNTVTNEIMIENMASKAAAFSKEDLFETVKRLQDDAQALKDSKKDLEELLQREEKQNQSQSIFKQ